LGYFKNINFFNYRNFSSLNFNFKVGCNVLVGKNGSGKTNILEGISLFEKGRGFRKDKIKNLINFSNNKTNFNIYSIFTEKKIDMKINVFNTEKNLKKITINESAENQSIKYFESLFSIIYFLPEMERMFVLPPSYRRNFLDRLIFSFSKDYNLTFNYYKKAINERYLLLKNQSNDEAWMNQVEDNIASNGINIYKKRIFHIQNINNYLNKINIEKNFANNFFLKLKDDFLEAYSRIYEDKDQYLYQLKKNRSNDFYHSGCSIGPHRSDIYCIDKNNNFNSNQLSTGQQKTLVILIIISHCIFLINDLRLHPIILLDEICSHLDDSNRELLLYLTNELKVQTFMTGTDKSFFSFLSTNAHYCNIT
tara:strand:+ start:381 stop:1475 length:1095 start_codon:yes stop_codon:yes gene_type:complete